MTYFKERAIENALIKWEGHAILREGYRREVYKDSLGKLTVGIGHLITPLDGLKAGDEISDARIMDLFRKDTDAALKTSLKQIYELGKFKDPNKYDADFLAALISANYQLGDWSKKFYNTYPKLVQGRWCAVIAALKKSAWAKQTPVRVEDFCKAIEASYA